MKSRVIGLTGGIAAGKSEAAHVLESLGAEVIDADQISRQVANLPEIQDKLKTNWPETFITGVLDRKQLGHIIFNSSEEREKLNKILHPVIIKEVLQAIKDSAKEVCIVVAPLLIEAGLHQMVDEVWLIHAPVDIQTRRLMEREGISKEEALRMIRSQLPAEEKLAHADRVFENTGSPEELKEELEKEWELLRTRI